MTDVIIIRCANGVVAWVAVRGKDHVTRWRCIRDGSFLTSPQAPADVEAFLQSMMQKSSSLAGAVLQVTELSV